MSTKSTKKKLKKEKKKAKKKAVKKKARKKEEKAKKKKKQKAKAEKKKKKKKGKKKEKQKNETPKREVIIAKKAIATPLPPKTEEKAPQAIAAKPKPKVVAQKPASSNGKTTTGPKASPVVKVQCSAITTRGYRCKNLTTRPDGLCPIHARLAAKK